MLEREKSLEYERETAYLCGGQTEWKAKEKSRRNEARGRSDEGQVELKGMNVFLLWKKKKTTVKHEKARAISILHCSLTVQNRRTGLVYVEYKSYENIISINIWDM